MATETELRGMIDELRRDLVALWRVQQQLSTELMLELGEHGIDCARALGRARTEVERTDGRGSQAADFMERLERSFLDRSPGPAPRR